MEIQFKGTNYELPAHISRLAQKKISTLRKYIGKLDETAQAYVELGKETEAHASGRIWRAEINFDLDGVRFRAVALEESIEVAINKAVNELAAEVRSAQKRKQDLARRGGATIKSFLRGFSS